jgi:hypothetical protein
LSAEEKKSMTGLSVDPTYLDERAEDQDYAAEKIQSAKEATKGIVTDLWFAHGPICGETVTAVEDLEQVRKATARTMKQVSDALAENLRAAARYYSAADIQYAAGLDQQVLSG